MRWVEVGSSSTYGEEPARLRGWQGVGGQWMAATDGAVRQDAGPVGGSGAGESGHSLAAVALPSAVPSSSSWLACASSPVGCFSFRLCSLFLLCFDVQRFGQISSSFLLFPLLSFSSGFSISYFSRFFSVPSSALAHFVLSFCDVFRSRLFLCLLAIS